MTKSKTVRRKKDPNVYPPGWDAARTKAIADYYDSRKDEDLFEESETARGKSGFVWIELPQDLVPAVLNLIARRKKPA